MARIDVPQDTVLDRIVHRLRDQLELNNRQCYETLDASDPPSVPVGGDYFLTVAPGDSSFAEGEQAVGNVTEEWSVTVTVYTRIQLDQTDHAKERLTDAARGLLAVKKNVLAALVGHDLQTSGGDTFLRQTLYATGCTRPELMTWAERGISLAAMRLDFGVSYDWDLT